MNCDIVKKKIYERIYSKIEDIDNEIIQHIGNCPDCSAYHQECSSAQKLTSFLNQRQPVLNNPQELTNNILDKIDGLDAEEENKNHSKFVIIKRILVAASICLMIVFGYEHYEVVEKLVKLEEQMSKVRENKAGSPHYPFLQYYYSIHKTGLIQSNLDLRKFEPKDKDLKSLFLKLKLKTLTPDGISKRWLQNQLSYYKLSGNEQKLLKTL